MIDYKIIASDLDGTLLDSSGKVSEENLSAIRAFSSRGIHFVPASGRSLSEMPEILVNEDSIRYYIHSSGAAVYDKKTREVISFSFPQALSRALLETAFASDCHVTVRRQGKMLMDKNKSNPEMMSYYNVFRAHAKLLCVCGVESDDFEAEMLSADGIEMISLFFHSDDVLRAVREKFLSMEGINVARACPHNIELTYKDAGKGNALSALARKLAVPLSSTIAVGDSENDLPMIMTAGLGLAVANASENVKKLADSIICGNDENAVAYIMEKYF